MAAERGGSPGSAPAPVTAPGTALESLAFLDLPEAQVTGEAVTLDLRPASFATRGLALALDLVVMAGLLLAGGYALDRFGGGLDDSAGRAVGLVLVVTALVGYPVLVETATRGRSLGKLAAGLRVVRDDGGPVRFRQSLVRGLVAVPEIYLIWGTALIASLSSARGKRLGDQLAGTYVTRVRTPPLPPPAAVMPPVLAGWAARADLGRIPDQLAAAGRGFLRRSASLHPASRSALARRLADELARHVAPPPPAGTHPEDFVAAVLAERRERDLVHLRAQAGRRWAREQARRQAPVLSAAGTSLLGGETPAATTPPGTAGSWPQQRS